MRDIPPSQVEEAPGEEGFIELAPGTLEAIKAAGRKLDDDVKAGRVSSGSSRWITGPGGDRFCIRHQGPTPEPPDTCETNTCETDICETDTTAGRRSWWRRLSSWGLPD
ncbi:hypothetical protein OW493_15880 [Cobetia sp. 14N.309.X.WAT.E.A4]|uniref:hypothetical protein n=1 Tax=Cobetia sp. 14N.309.X.WAT.E.A4 TaxID=2998323 RepID=UPI0025B25DDC|nr:hypothetical protein [Cobetia sp. 14N.309.X.WAT.E.A4]MDN2657920.1 hypothetical protein [Cobetia sp. 14N.309.X.WAT.E.A4]